MSWIDRQFVHWFYDQQYAEPNHNRNGWMKQYYNNENPDHRNYWMREAFLAGARAQAQHTLNLIQNPDPDTKLVDAYVKLKQELNND